MLKQQINISWPKTDLPFEEKPYDLTLTHSDMADPEHPILLEQRSMKELSFETLLSLRDQIDTLLDYKALVDKGRT